MTAEVALPVQRGRRADRGAARGPVIDVRLDGVDALVTLHGTADAECSARLGAMLRAVIGVGARRVVLDVSGGRLRPDDATTVWQVRDLLGALGGRLLVDGDDPVEIGERLEEAFAAYREAVLPQPGS